MLLHITIESTLHLLKVNLGQYKYNPVSHLRQLLEKICLEHDQTNCTDVGRREQNPLPGIARVLLRFRKSSIPKPTGLPRDLLSYPNLLQVRSRSEYNLRNPRVYFRIGDRHIYSSKTSRKYSARVRRDYRLRAILSRFGGGEQRRKNAFPQPPALHLSTTHGPQVTDVSISRLMRGSERPVGY